MGARGVDFCNRRSTKYRYSHKQFKWWKSCYLHLLHLAVSNAYVIDSEFKKYLKDEEKIKRINYKEFYSSIIESLIGNIQQKIKKSHQTNCLHLFEFIDPVKKTL